MSTNLGGLPKRLSFLAEDPRPEARAFERRGGCLTVRVSADANLQAAALDPGAFLTPGLERKACRHARVKTYLGIGPEISDRGRCRLAASSGSEFARRRRCAVNLGSDCRS